MASVSLQDLSMMKRFALGSLRKMLALSLLAAVCLALSGSVTSAWAAAPAAHKKKAHAAGRRRRAGRRGAVHKTSARSRHHRRSVRKPLTRKQLARSHKLKQAFVASSQLRPMAQQLAQNRTPAAYAGVANYARSHAGEAGSAAYMAMGHAYLLDHNFPQAVSSFQRAGQLGQVARRLRRIPRGPGRPAGREAAGCGVAAQWI